MFFSIIIPTYNPRQFLPTLLSSIVTNECIDDIEIIISDDCSTESFKDICNQFPQCHFKFITNDKHYGFPRVGRENGAQAASGEWICFIDQDDYFTNGIFDNLKSNIIDNNFHNCVITKIYKKTLQEQFLNMDYPWELTHGKFYEKIFWQQYNIHYPEVKYCEDSCIQSIIECTLINNNLESNILDTFSYVWVERADSVSYSNSVEYLVDSFMDFLHGGFVNFVDNFISQNILSEKQIEWYTNTIIIQFIRMYFEFQTLYIKPIEIEVIPKELLICFKKALYAFLNKINLSEKQLITKIENEYAEIYNLTRHANYAGNEIHLIEKQSLYDFIKLLKLLEE